MADTAVLHLEMSAFANMSNNPVWKVVIVDLHSARAQYPPTAESPGIDV